MIAAKLVLYADGVSQDVSIKYTKRLAKAGIQPEIVNVGIGYDNALAETVNRRYKAAVIDRCGP